MSIAPPQSRSAVAVETRGPDRIAGQLTRFIALGAASTAAYFVLYLVLRGYLGAFAANPCALLITSVVNTAANRRLTFGVRGRRGNGRQHIESLCVFGLGLTLTSSALGLVSILSDRPARPVELGALVAVKLAAATLRFVVFRHWIFHPRRRKTPITAGRL
jgi:putative flippase GtrA